MSAPLSPGEAGKRYRLGRIFGATGRTVVLPVDHGLMLGRVSGLEDPVASLTQFLSHGCDGFLIGPGVARRTAELFADRGTPARVVTIDTYWRDKSGGVGSLVAQLAAVAALGVDGVKLLLPWDVEPRERCANAALVGSVIAEADGLGLPVMVEPIALEMAPSPERVAVEADGCRMAAELGADIVKVAYPGAPSTLAAWREEVGVPVVILGGPQGGSSDELVTMVSEAMAAGASGIVIGRKVWQRPAHEAHELLDRLAAVVHA